MSAEAIAALEAEIKTVEDTQAPVREQIATLQAQLSEGEQTIARNRAAIALLNGDAPLHTRTVRRARSSTRTNTGTAPATPAEVASRDRIVDFIGANGPNVKAGAIAEGIGHSGGQALTKVLMAMVDDGVLIREGEKRGTNYSLKIGPA